jgi:hypothetical protein
MQVQTAEQQDTQETNSAKMKAFTKNIRLHIASPQEHHHQAAIYRKATH